MPTSSGIESSTVANDFASQSGSTRRSSRRFASWSRLAPLHQPKSIAALDAVTAVLPDLPAVACFDTAFHATLPKAAATYALPAEWRNAGNYDGTDSTGYRTPGWRGALPNFWAAR